MAVLVLVRVDEVLSELVDDFELAMLDLDTW